MSLGLLTALLLVGAAAAQCGKPAELPMNPNVNCTAEEAELLEENGNRRPDTVGQIIISDNEVRTTNVIPRQIPLYPAGCYAVEEPETLEVMPAEAEEPEVCEQTEPLPCRKPEPVEARVAELLEACQRAIADGKTDEAQSLIYQAILLDPACIAVNALAERLQEMDQPCNSGEESKEQPCEDPSGSSPVDPITAPEEMLQPSLPPVDPGIVNALEEVLRETGEPSWRK